MPGAFTSGLGSQLGISVPEASYGAEKTVTKFFEYSSETMQLSRAFLLSSQLRAGRMYQSSGRRTATTKNAAGTTPMEVPTNGFGTLLNLLHGEVATPVKGTGALTYKSTHKIGTTDSYLKSSTLQVGKPTDEGVVQPFTYPGSVLLSMAFDCQSGGFLTATPTWDSQDELTVSPALATASYPTKLESFNFTQCKVVVNSVEQKQVRGVSLAINTPKDTGRYYLGTEKKAVPLLNAYNGSTITLTVDYADNTLYKLFSEAKIVPVEISFVGNIIEAALKYELKFVCTTCGLDGDSPNVTGPPVLQQQIPMVVLDGGTEPPIIATYQSEDVTL